LLPSIEERGGAQARSDCKKRRKRGHKKGSLVFNKIVSLGLGTQGKGKGLSGAGLERYEAEERDASEKKKKRKIDPRGKESAAHSEKKRKGLNRTKKKKTHCNLAEAKWYFLKSGGGKSVEGTTNFN